MCSCNFVYFSSDSPSVEVGEGWGGGHDDHECKFMFIYNHFRLDIIALTIVQQKMHRPSCHGRRHDI